MTALTGRQQQLLTVLKADRRPVTTGRVHEINRLSLGAPKRTTARRDIAALHRAGLLIEGQAPRGRFYLLTRKATS